MTANIPVIVIDRRITDLDVDTVVVDDKEKRASLVDELAVASVLIYRFWQERRKTREARGGGAHRERHDASRKTRQRLH